MEASVLERMLVVERHRRKAPLGGGDFSVPALEERPVEEFDEPLLVTNMRGDWVQTRRSGSGYGRFGFTECEVGDEAHLVSSLWATLTKVPWAIKCNDVATAVRRVDAAKTLLVSYEMLKEFSSETLTTEEVAKIIFAQGYITKVGELGLLASEGLSGRTAIVTTVPALTGFYTRIDDHLGLMLLSADKTIAMVTL
jgi:hypothetical protein